MELSRARQIIQSPEKIEIQYQGISVWIENVDQNNETAVVQTIGNKDDCKVVPIRDLEEQ